MVKSFISGAGGFVASHLADYLLEKGEIVYASYRWYEDLSKIDHLRNHKNFHLIPMDLNDLSSCQKAIEESKPDFIFHLAAQSYVSDSFIYPHATIETNTLGTLNLLEAIRIVRDKFKTYDLKEIYKMAADGTKYDPIIHVCSSSEVYGQVKKEDIPIKESQPFNPANPYAVGKVGADMLGLLYFKNYGLKIIRTRMFTHTGPRRIMDSAEIAFAKQIVRIEKGLQKPIIKVGNLDSIRTFADVRDAVKAYWLMMRKCTPGEVYNIGGDRTMSIGDMLQMLVGLSTYKNPFRIEEDPKLLRPSDVTLQIPDISKFAKETGWKSEIPFEKTLGDILEYLRRKI